MQHKYIYIQKSQESFINGKVQHHTQLQFVYIVLMKINHPYIKYEISFFFKSFHQSKNKHNQKNILFHHILLLFKFINFQGMGNIRCMVVLLMSLQMWMKFNQYYHIYHMMVQQQVCFLNYVLNTNHLVCQEMFIQIW